VQADNLSLAYGGQPVLEDAGFSIQRGEKCGLIGRNGAGKSTLFRLIAGEEQPDSGRIILPKGYRLGILRQQIHFTKDTVIDESATGLKDDEKDLLYKVERILFGLGFNEEDMHKSPHSFSGGYQLRIQLAKVLCSEPDCLLLDEPTNYLDILSIRFLTEFLREWEGEMILISHDLQFLDAVTTHMMAIHRQGVYKIKGKSADIYELIALEEETYEKNRLTQDKKRAHMESFVERFGAKASKAAQAQARVKQLEKLPVLEKLKGLNQLGFVFQEIPFNGKKMLEANNLSFAYKPEIPLIDDFSLIIEKGDRIAIIGKNGFGKSTLLKLLSQELKAAAGVVNPSEAMRLGYFGQTSIERLNPALRIEEEIGSANTKLSFSQVRSICGTMMFGGDLAKKPVSVLSGGEKSRVLLGKIVAQPCNILFLDEPTHHLDIESIESLIDAIETFKGAVVIITHSEWVLRRIPFNKLVVCHKEKQELFVGNYDDFLEKVGWEEEGPGPKKKKDKSGSSSKEKGPSKDEIKACEDKISQVEEEIEKNQAKLSEASETGNTEKIREIGALLAKLQDQLDNLYILLGRLYS
jgi:ATP-binding cassette subfamily F protein 3